MNFMKRISILTALVAVMFAFNACEEDAVGPVVDSPSNVTSLEANSADAMSVNLKWDAPSDLDATMFQDYTVAYYPKSTGSENAPDTTVTDLTVMISGLDMDKEYTFKVITNYTNGESSTGTTITWAPAIRFNTVDATTIKIYAHTSNFGSGIALYDSFDESPKVYTVGKDGINVVNWHLGLDTKTSGEINFGSASSTTYIGASTAINSAMITKSLIPANGLSDVFDSQRLDNKSFELQTIKLAGIVPADGKTGFVLYAKTDNGTEAHYAKIFIKYNTASNSVLFGTGDDQYIEVTISYQKNADSPYAKK